ncbi:MAG: hypothetical protein RJQ34_11785 [Balneola sp.]
MLTNTACDTTGTKDEPEYLEFPLPVNEKISKLYDCCDEPDRVGYRNYHFAEWYPGEVYITFQMRRVTLEPRTSIPFVTGEQLIDGNIMYMTKSETENRLYTVRTKFYKESVGRLNEYDISGDTFTTIRDSSYNISSIRIRELQDGSLLKVYYSYGNEDTGLEAGYYRLSETGPPDELLLAHSNPDGPKETINGFDLSPDGSTLLYPIQPDLVPGPATYGGPRPELAKLNLNTEVRDTLPVTFNQQQFLWARYHPSGEKLVVSNYPRNIVGNVVRSVDLDSMYVVDLNTFHRRPLDTRTWDQHYTTDIFPSWSPDGNYLIYSSGIVFPKSTTIGEYSIYTLDMTED